MKSVGRLQLSLSFLCLLCLAIGRRELDRDCLCGVETLRCHTHTHDEADDRGRRGGERSRREDSWSGEEAERCTRRSPCHCAHSSHSLSLSSLSSSPSSQWTVRAPHPLRCVPLPLTTRRPSAASSHTTHASRRVRLRPLESRPPVDRSRPLLSRPPLCSLPPHSLSASNSCRRNEHNNRGNHNRTTNNRRVSAPVRSIAQRSSSRSWHECQRKVRRHS